MENLMSIAGYIYKRYERQFSETIDEMKIHKLMYFAQRESFIQNDEALFEGVFRAWKFGPILKEIRNVYKSKNFTPFITSELELTPKLISIFSIVFSNYAIKDSWSLSRLTHNELSWKNARKGIPENENGDNPISNSDIRLDAQRIKERRIVFA